MREVIEKRTIDFAWLRVFHLTPCRDINSYFIFTMYINYGKGHELDEMKIFHGLICVNSLVEINLVLFVSLNSISSLYMNISFQIIVFR